jgi:hypothetical protein
MRTKTLNIYTYEELTPEAREKACEQYRQAGMDYHWSDEWRDSLKGFSDTFPIRLRTWEVSTHSHTSFNFGMTNDNIEDVKGVRLYKYLQNNYNMKDLLSGNCPFTGYCGDESFLAPLQAFMKKPDNRTFRELMNDCLENGFSDWQKDMEYQESDDYIADHLIINGYEFEEDGTMA